MKIKLSIADRLELPVLFPQQGTILVQMVVKDIIAKIDLSADEIKQIGLKQEDNLLKWNQDESNKLDKEIDFSDAEINFLRSRVDELDKEGKVTLRVVELFNRIKNLTEIKIIKDIKK